MLSDLARWQSATGAHRQPAWRRACTGWAAELRQTARGLVVRPIHTASMVALTALGIGAVTAAFAVAYGLLWRPLPYPDGDRLAVLWQVERGEATQVSAFDGVTTRLTEMDALVAYLQVLGRLTGAAFQNTAAPEEVPDPQQ